jgi:hypothetical protein
MMAGGTGTKKGCFTRKKKVKSTFLLWRGRLILLLIKNNDFTELILLLLFTTLRTLYQVADWNLENFYPVESLYPELCWPNKIPTEKAENPLKE